MNYALVSRLLGLVSWLIGGTMLFSLPWAWPALGHATEFETNGFLALFGSIAICFVTGALLRQLGTDTKTDTLYRKEAMAVVALSWILATILGAMPYYLSSTATGWADEAAGIPSIMTFTDCLFEAQSGFSTTGSTVLAELENPLLVARSILFWRSSTHFLGGLGIIVLFVALLGQGSTGKVLMRAEMTVGTQGESQERMQDTAWSFAATYIGLNVILAIILKLEGMTLPSGSMSWFDAICHAFGTMATGGFSTYNGSLGHFDSPLIEYTVMLFMILAGTNFALMLLSVKGNPMRLLRDTEWQVYLALICGATAVIVFFGLYYSTDFNPDGTLTKSEEFWNALRYGSFQVVSILTTTGYVTADWNHWPQFSRFLLFSLMFFNGCSGSTSGGIKVLRHILLYKILRLEIEQSFHPSVVRHLKMGGKVVENVDIRKQVLVFFMLYGVVFMASWTFLMAVEPETTWTAHGYSIENKMPDTASAVVTMFANTGPGLGTVGAVQNFAHITTPSKLVLIAVMFLGRLEMFAVLVLFMPSFWRSH